MYLRAQPAGSQLANACLAAITSSLFLNSGLLAETTLTKAVQMKEERIRVLEDRLRETVEAHTQLKEVHNAKGTSQEQQKQEQCYGPGSRLRALAFSFFTSRLGAGESDQGL